MSPTGWAVLAILAVVYVVAVEWWEHRREQKWRKLALDFEEQARLAALKRMSEERRKKDAA